MARKVTLESIAKSSGVSLATTSLVLRDKPGINPETRRKVLEAARQLGYYKNSAPTPTPLSRDLTTIGLIIRSQPGDLPQANDFYSQVLTGIEDACRKQQVNLLYATMPVDEDYHPLELPRLLFEDTVNGILLVGTLLDSTMEEVFVQRNIPLVLVDSFAASYNYDAVVSDNFNSAYRVVSYLAEQGHRQIALVGSLPRAYPSIEERRKGYIRAMDELELGKKSFADCYWIKKEAFRATTELLKSQPQITALFCCNDDTAIGAMQAAQALGRRIPEDLTIVGFDDIVLAEHLTPALTTIRIDKHTMGRMAVQLLANRVSYPKSSNMIVTIKGELVERQSVARLNPF